MASNGGNLADGLDRSTCKETTPICPKDEEGIYETISLNDVPDTEPLSILTVDKGVTGAGDEGISDCSPGTSDRDSASPALPEPKHPPKKAHTHSHKHNSPEKRIDHNELEYRVDVETPEKEIEDLQLIVAKQKVDIERAIDHIHYLEEVNLQQGLARAEIEAKFQSLLKQYDNAKKDKEATVIRYAISEKNVIDQKNAKEQVERQLRDTNKENEILQHKLASIQADKARICQMFDNKCHELVSANKETEKWKTETNVCENRIKTLKHNLKTENDSYKDSLVTIEALNERLAAATSEIETAKREAQEKIRGFQESQENRAYLLDKQLKEITANLILVRHECSDREQRAHSLQIELDMLHAKRESLIQENNELTMRVQNLEHDRLEANKKVAELRESKTKEQEQATYIQSMMAQFEQIKIQMTNDQEVHSTNQILVEQLKFRNAELQADIDACRQREEEMLQFTQMLTEKNVRLQSEFSGVETKVQQLSCEENSVQRINKDLSTRLNSVMHQLEEEKNCRAEENSILAHHLAEKTKICDQLTKQLEFQKGENQVLKRKFDTSLKQMTKELQMCHKQIDKIDSQEEKSRSRSSSSCSHVMSPSMNIATREPDAQSTVGGSIDLDAPADGMDKQTLLDHVMRLQRASARKSEKLDFLEEHVRSLVAELQRKNRVLQDYMIRDQTGALTSDAMDKNKAEVAKSKGVMASMFNSRVSDNHLTLDLSLDINRKLQAVLEDTILKNITLKENVDTLGAEIERLRQNNCIEL